MDFWCQCNKPLACMMNFGAARFTALSHHCSFILQIHSSINTIFFCFPACGSKKIILKEGGLGEWVCREGLRTKRHCSGAYFRHWFFTQNATWGRDKENYIIWYISRGLLTRNTVYLTDADTWLRAIINYFNMLILFYLLSVITGIETK